MTSYTAFQSSVGGPGWASESPERVGPLFTNPVGSMCGPVFCVQLETQIAFAKQNFIITFAFQVLDLFVSHQILPKIATRPPSVSCFARFSASRLPAQPKVPQNCLILILISWLMMSA